MKACVLHSPAAVETNPLVYEQTPDPEPRDDEVLVRVHACDVCKTDLYRRDRLSNADLALPTGLLCHGQG